MISKERKFIVKLVDHGYVDYPFFIPKDKHEKPYVVGEKNATFVIEMQVNPEVFDVTQIYGTKLMIDGEIVKGIKTFKVRGKYFGFKMGNGKYKKFCFGSPNYDSGENASNASSIGKIKIVFYSTTKIKNNKNIRMRHHNYEPMRKVVAESSKKLCFNSIQVAEGQEFDNGHTQRMKKRDMQFFEYLSVLNDDDDIDEIEINYIDYYGLVAKGYVSSKCLNHFEYIPYRIKENSNINVIKNAISKILEKYVNDEGTLSILELMKFFNMYSKHSIDKHLGKYSSIQALIKNEFADLIQLNEDTNCIKFKELTDDQNKFQNDSYLIPSQQILSADESQFINRRRLDRKTNLSNIMEVEPEDVVDLTIEI